MVATMDDVGRRSSGVKRLSGGPTPFSILNAASCSARGGRPGSSNRNITNTRRGGRSTGGLNEVPAHSKTNLNNLGRGPNSPIFFVLHFVCFSALLGFRLPPRAH